MNMKNPAAITAGAAALALCLGALPTQEAHAAFDDKGISATACQPFLPTTYSDARFQNNAIINVTEVNQRVICPVNKDAQVNWELGKVRMHVYIKAGSKSGKVSCTLYGGGTAYGTQVAYTATSAVLAPGAASSISIPDIVDPAGGFVLEGWNLLCTLNSGMALSGVWWGEDYDTDASEAGGDL